MDKLDSILQELCPTVMVPKYSELPELAIGNRRYLMAADGLWLETRQPWGRFRLPLWESPVSLPYGSVKKMFCMESIHDSLIYECYKMALIKAYDRKEWAGWITWDAETGYVYTPLEVINESIERIDFRRPILPTGSFLVMDLHSHPFDMDAFSEDDDIDNCGGVYIAGVVSFNKNFEPVLTKRLCIEGHFFDIREIK
jgi:PRTRC genetic system protein A